MNKCCICSKYIDGTDWLCSNCAIEYSLLGVAVKNWPLWAKILKNDESRERKRNKRIKDLGYINIGIGTIEDIERLEDKQDILGSI